jgi:cobalt/nickel transport protein
MRSRFLLGFLLATLLIAGGLSYLASSDPDGLDSVALNGCTVSETEAGEQLDGTCIAQNAAAQYPSGHEMAGSPLADYAIGGRDGTTGLAGVVGVLVTALLAGLLFRVLRRPSRPSDRASGRPSSRTDGA